MIDLIGAFVVGGLLVATVVLAIHDQQNIGALKRQHARLKKLELAVSASTHEDYRSGSDSQ